MYTIAETKQKYTPNWKKNSIHTNINDSGKVGRMENERAASEINGTLDLFGRI